MRQAVIVEAVRTPIGRRNGMLSGHHPVNLGAHVLNSLISRAGVGAEEVEDVIWGCVSAIGEQAANIGRWTVLAAGWPDTIPATTVDRACGSSQQAIHFAAAGVVAGHYDMVIAGGVESMSRVPMGSTRTSGHGEARGPVIAARYPDVEFSQGIAAEMVARKWGLSREQVDEFSLNSHARAAAATKDGLFDEQITPIPETEAGPAAQHDEGIRVGGTLESLAKLRTVFDPDGVVTAGNSSQISDGAAAVLITTPEKARQLGLQPLARFHSVAVTATDPVLMLTGPIQATAGVLARAGLRLPDIGVYEVNEAFAPVPLAWMAETGADPARLNPNGGAIALGHPLGASGARITTTMVNHMRANNIRFGLQTICEAGGMANAMILELPSEAA